MFSTSSALVIVWGVFENPTEYLHRVVSYDLNWPCRAHFLQSDLLAAGAVIVRLSSYDNKTVYVKLQSLARWKLEKYTDFYLP